MERKSKGNLTKLVPLLSTSIFRSRLKDICNPLLKKPVSEEGKLEMKIVSLPPLFGSKRQRMKNFESFGNENFDVNWIGLENY